LKVDKFRILVKSDHGCEKWPCHKSVKHMRKHVALLLPNSPKLVPASVPSSWMAEQIGASTRGQHGRDREQMTHKTWTNLQKIILNEKSNSKRLRKVRGNF
jgi:hypothetical protein